ncbi:MAG TPA: S-layer homology domain-containing protein [Blastocatellia bacterium]|nr:S-layer homology domain-containing protein [Blastocatellia bacterium]
MTAGGGCNWSATTSDPSMVTITSGNGTGNGMVSFTVSANTATTSREATISVGPHTFRVLQGAKFLDVGEGDLFYTEIGKLSARGVTSGCGGGNYCPGAPVLRDQMASFILKALGEFNPPQPAMQRFADVPPSNIFYAFIDRMAVLGITAGCGGGNYCPSQPVTRGQMAAFLVRAFNL